jgi:DNA-binding NarL/FixJ family response regulator
MREGQSTEQIARMLAIALSTARTHVQSVLVKLGAHSRLEATSLAARYCLDVPATAIPAAAASG